MVTYDPHLKRYECADGDFCATDGAPHLGHCSRVDIIVHVGHELKVTRIALDM